MTRSRSRYALVLAVLCGGQALFADAAAYSDYRIDPLQYLNHVKALASDDFAGRGNGTPGLGRAADYIAAEFKKARLIGGGDNRDYLQRFDASGYLEGGAGTLLLHTPGGDIAFRIGLQYYPLSTLSSAGAPAPIVAVAFAGYGIEAPGLGYDDYAGLDAAGKAVIVFTHEPQENDSTSVFEGRALTPHSDLREKAAVAARHGARALIVVEDPTHAVDRALTREWTRDPQIDRFDIPVFRVDRARLDRALTAIDFESTARRIDRLLTPDSRDLDAVTLAQIDPLTPLSSSVSNVIGVWRGSDPAVAAEAIVIGAHYDHLGRGGRSSEDASGVGQIHNGADDNASGTAAIIGMAQTLGRNGMRFRRSIIFAAFAGEEIGLLGSQYYTRRPPVGASKTIAMINLDMIGRARGRVMVSGLDRPPFAAALRLVRSSVTLRLTDFRDGYQDGASDNASFEREHIPTLAFFTGFHDDYHRPSDDWDQIDAQGGSQIAQLALAVAAQLAER
jgi:hypothetical protein